MLTHHAQKRLQQRSISEEMIQFISLYGEETLQKGGAHEVWLSRKAVKSLRKDLKSTLKHLDSLANAYFIEGDHGQIVTVGHKY